MPLREMDLDRQRRTVLGWVQTLTRWERFTLLKMLTGELRLGVSQTLVVRALAQASAIEPATMAARLMGEWTPSARWFGGLVDPGDDRHRSIAALPVLPGRADRRLAGAGANGRSAGRSSGLASRMEVGRHPGAAGQARRPGASVVARRRINHAPVSRSRRRDCRAPRRRRARRRGSRLPGRPPAAVLGPAAAPRPRAPVIARGAGCAGGVHGLRRARTSGEDIRERPLHQRRAILRSIIEAAQSVAPPTPTSSDAAPLLPFSAPATTAGAIAVAIIAACSMPTRWHGARRSSQGCAPAGRRRLDAQAAVLRLPASDASAATGGNGRSIRTPSTPC